MNNTDRELEKILFRLRMHVRQCTRKGKFDDDREVERAIQAINRIRIQDRIDEVERFEALDQVGTLERINREVLYLDRRKSQLQALITKEKEDE